MGIFSKSSAPLTSSTKKTTIPPDLQTRQKKNFITTFSMLAKLARADGRVSKAEITVINDLINNRLQLDEDKKTYAIKIFNEARDSSTSFEDYALEFKEINKGQPQMHEWLVELLLSVAFADQVYSPNEREIIDQVKSIFGLSEEAFLKIKEKYGDDLDKSLSILNCSMQDSLDQIEGKYRTL